jgi:hypothetical protein
MQLFGPAADSTYGGGPRPNEGFFFTYDWLRWTISAPEDTPIGFPNLTRTVYYTPTRSTVQSNTLNTEVLDSNFRDGGRMSFGQVEGHDGWMFNYWRLKQHHEKITANGVDMVFQDETFGNNQRSIYGWVYDVAELGQSQVTLLNPQLHDLPLSFDEVTVDTSVDTWNVELMYLRRLHPRGRGVFEWQFGVRYLEFDDLYKFTGTGERFVYDSASNLVGPATVLSESTWTTEAENHIVGPQVAVNYVVKAGRWSLGSNGRFFAGFNSQNIDQQGTLGSRLDEPYPGTITAAPVPTPVRAPWVPETMTPTTFTHGRHFSEWSPAIELRLDLKYQVTRAISLNAGWTALWMDGIARSVNVTDYRISTTNAMGIIDAHNRQDVFMNGFNVGVEVNR